MQIQGDVQEDDLKMMLQTNFSMDVVEDVPTGIKGIILLSQKLNINAFLIPAVGLKNRVLM